MNIKIGYTLMINDGEKYINDGAEVSVTTERLLDNFQTQVYSGMFISCNDDGIFVEVGMDESKVIFIEYDEIVEIEERQ